jgi:hypothetical protein
LELVVDDQIDRSALATSPASPGTVTTAGM